MDEATRTIWVTSSPDAEYFYIKPLPEGEPLPTFVFMVLLISEPVSGLRHSKSPQTFPITMAQNSLPVGCLTT